MFPIVAATVYIPTVSAEVFLFFHFVANTCFLFNASHSKRCEVLFHGFSSHFSEISDGGEFAIYVLAIVISSLEKVLTLFLCLFLNWINLNFCYYIVLVLYTFYILTPLLNMWFVNIFSPIIGCLFILLIVSFDAQKHFSLM